MMKTTLYALVLLPLFAAPVLAETLTGEQIKAKLRASFGLDEWHSVDTLSFTFNVKMGDTRKFRSWTWRPKTNEVTYAGPLGDQDRIEHAYDRDTLTHKPPKRTRTVDAMFINDTFWLLLPLHLAWSKDATVTDGGYQMTPDGKQVTRQVVVQYPKTGGYTPGDMYKLYVDDAWRIVQWSYHKAGADEPTLQTIWQQDEQLGPLRLTTNFTWQPTDFRLWFAGVRLKTTDGTWHEPVKIDHKCRTCP